MHIHGWVKGWLPNIDVIPSKQPNIDKAVGGRTRPLVVSDWHWIDFTQGPSFLAGQVQWIMCDASIKRSLYNNEAILESRVSFLSLLLLSISTRPAFREVGRSSLISKLPAPSSFNCCHLHHHRHKVCGPDSEVKSSLWPSMGLEQGTISSPVYSH